MIDNFAFQSLRGYKKFTWTTKKDENEKFIKPKGTLKIYLDNEECMDNALKTKYLYICSTKYPIKKWENPFKIQCTRCFKFHHYSLCDMPIVCKICGENKSENHICSNIMKCINCKGLHASDSPRCKKRRKF